MMETMFKAAARLRLDLGLTGVSEATRNSESSPAKKTLYGVRGHGTRSFTSLVLGDFADELVIIKQIGEIPEVKHPDVSTVRV